MCQYSSFVINGSDQRRGIRACTRNEKARRSPIRPRPMNPHDAWLEGVGANDRRDVVESDRAAGRLGSVQI